MKLMFNLILVRIFTGPSKLVIHACSKCHYNRQKSFHFNIFFIIYQYKTQNLKTILLIWLQNKKTPKKLHHLFIIILRLYMAEILPIWCKTLSNQSINHYNTWKNLLPFYQNRMTED